MESDNQVIQKFREKFKPTNVPYQDGGEFEVWERELPDGEKKV